MLCGLDGLVATVGSDCRFQHDVTSPVGKMSPKAGSSEEFGYLVDQRADKQMSLGSCYHIVPDEDNQLPLRSVSWTS